jgi:hypothetical protein
MSSRTEPLQLFSCPTRTFESIGAAMAAGQEPAVPLYPSGHTTAGFPVLTIQDDIP